MWTLTGWFHCVRVAQNKNNNPKQNTQRWNWYVLVKELSSDQWYAIHHTGVLQHNRAKLDAIVRDRCFFPPIVIVTIFSPLFIDYAWYMHSVYSKRKVFELSKVHVIRQNIELLYEDSFNLIRNAKAKKIEISAPWVSRNGFAIKQSKIHDKMFGACR